jgi:hypothetical protein
MNNETVTFLNWMGLFLLVPGGICIGWLIVGDVRQHKKITANSITSILLFLATLIGLIQLNIQSQGWLRWSILLIQLAIVGLLHKMIWSPFVRKFRGLD